ELISDQKILLKTPNFSDQSTFHENLSKRIDHILGKEVFTSLIPLSFTQGSYELKGFIGESHLHRPNRLGQFLFINQRSIYSPLISSAVREGYGSMLPNQRFPFFVIHLNMPGHLFDVNVHPQKKEVRLRQEFQLKEVVIEAVQNALRKQQNQNTYYTPINLTKDESEEKLIPPYWNSYASLLSKNTFEVPSKVTEEKWEYKKCDPNIDFPVQTESELKDLDQILQKCDVEPSLFSLNKIPKKTPTVISTIVGYLLIDPFNVNKELFRLKEGEAEGGIALVDQKAAYSRVFFEKLLSQKAANDIQPLLVPLTIQFSMEEARNIREYLEILNNMGFSLREFGEYTFMIDALPNFIKQDQVETCLSILLKELGENQTSRYLQKEKEKQLALMACRASLPKLKQLSIEEGQYLMNQLMTCEMPAQCPMGKPTCFYLSVEEIGKFFR
ncbi:MAG: DNA mismatch repair endonuclease MutL, partial [Parachlamydiaceae bacterium]|nr:DNA mismatch repair endonuclease MutL [Parachlamydiaceae bacterium]